MSTIKPLSEAYAASDENSSFSNAAFDYSRKVMPLFAADRHVGIPETSRHFGVIPNGAALACGATRC
jgi:hypothetical protein